MRYSSLPSRFFGLCEFVSGFGRVTFLSGSRWKRNSAATTVWKLGNEKRLRVNATASSKAMSSLLKTPSSLESKQEYQRLTCLREFERLGGGFPSHSRSC